MRSRRHGSVTKNSKPDTWFQPLIPTLWKNRTDSQELGSDLHVHTVDAPGTVKYAKNRKRNACETNRVKVYHMSVGRVRVAQSEMSQPTSSLLWGNILSTNLRGKKAILFTKEGGRKEGRKEGRMDKRFMYCKESIEMGKSLFSSFLLLHIWKNTDNSAVAYFPCGGTKDIVLPGHCSQTQLSF